MIGIDCSFGLPFAERGGFFPGASDSPDSARALWAEVDAAGSDDDDLAPHNYIDRRRQWFWFGAADGSRGLFDRVRRSEAMHRQQKLGAPASPFVLLGASQVGKATLSGMRLLNRVGSMSIWPFDPVPESGPLLLEIYCQTFARDGGTRGKFRSRDALNGALRNLGSPEVGVEIPETFADHIGDALISAAGMRRAALDPAYWSPPDLTPEIARTEGWTFGIL